MSVRDQRKDVKFELLKNQSGQIDKSDKSVPTASNTETTKKSPWMFEAESMKKKRLLKICHYNFIVTKSTESTNITNQSSRKLVLITALFYFSYSIFSLFRENVTKLSLWLMVNSYYYYNFFNIILCTIFVRTVMLAIMFSNCRHFCCSYAQPFQKQTIQFFQFLATH